MWTPWLVYDVYPRKNTISVIYILKKTLVGIFIVFTSYILFTEYVQPWIEMGNQINIIELIVR